MILVTVGNHVQAFDRLIRAADEIAGCIEEKVIIQTGHSKYTPSHAEYFNFTSGTHITQLTGQARVQISHAGAGSIITAVRMGKPLIVAPRLKRYSEHIDDHQLQLAQALNAQGKLVAISEVNPQTLLEALKKVETLVVPKNEPGISDNGLVRYISGYLASFSQEIASLNGQ